MPPIVELPSGTVTFLFTDVEGSTRLLKQLGDGYGDVLAAHQSILREAFVASDGQEIDTQGDSFFVAFSRAKDAVAAAVECQRRLAAHPWPDEAELRVRMGVHTRRAGGQAGTLCRPLIVCVTEFVFGLIRRTLEPASFVTQTEPAPTAIAVGVPPAGIVFTTVPFAGNARRTDDRFGSRTLPTGRFRASASTRTPWFRRFRACRVRAASPTARVGSRPRDGSDARRSVTHSRHASHGRK